jgi:hypothetical protein
MLSKIEKRIEKKEIRTAKAKLNANLLFNSKQKILKANTL